MAPNNNKKKSNNLTLPLKSRTFSSKILCVRRLCKVRSTWSRFGQTHLHTPNTSIHKILSILKNQIGLPDSIIFEWGANYNQIYNKNSLASINYRKLSKLNKTLPVTHKIYMHLNTHISIDKNGIRSCMTSS